MAQGPQARLRGRYFRQCCRGRCSLPSPKNKDGLHGSLRMVVELAILLKLIDKVSKCQWLTNCLVFSSV